MVMTANEARQKAESFNLIKNDNTVYKKIQEAIQDSASKGRYYIIVDFLRLLSEWETAVFHTTFQLKDD